MADYDSDSSLEEQTEYDQTNVLLGYASKEPTDDHVSHLGGHPTWLDTESFPSASLAKCRSCNDLMSLLLLLNGDLPSRFPDDERRLHVFACRKRRCNRKPGSIRALREVKKHKKVKPSASPKHTPAPNTPAQKSTLPQDLGAALFQSNKPSPTAKTNPLYTSASTSGQPANPFSSLPHSSTLAAKPPQQPVAGPEPPIETFASKLKFSASVLTPASTSEPWPAISDLPRPYPHFHLDADYETLEPTQPTQTSSSVNPTPFADEADPTTNDRDGFTEDKLDKTFDHFAERLAQNPQQILRYEFKGKPLLFSGSDAVAQRFGVVAGKPKSQTQGMPRCEACGAQRVFELQLVPGAITVLEEELGLGVDEGMEWGTVILGVCEADCGVVGEAVWREEWVGVQWEERVLRKLGMYFDYFIMDGPTSLGKVDNERYPDVKPAGSAAFFAQEELPGLMMF